jgi:hypothetical protein
MEEGLQQEFNSLDARREAAEAYIASQKGWQVGTRIADRGITSRSDSKHRRRRVK